MIPVTSVNQKKNVIKIKPPLIFSTDNAKFFLKLFSKIINEDFMLN